MASRPALKVVTEDDPKSQAHDAEAIVQHDSIDLSGLPSLLLVSEVVDLRRLGKSHVYGLVESKQIVSLKMGGSIRVPRAAVQDYLRRCNRGQQQHPSP